MLPPSPETSPVTQVIKGICIPPKPELLNALQREMEHDNFDLERIGQLISQDVALSAAVLKLINSAYFGLKNKIVSITHATSLLGAKLTVNLVSGFLLEHSIEDKSNQFTGFWDSAANMAKFCAFASNRLKLVDVDEAYLMGLFHDVGIPLLANNYSDYKDTFHKGLNSDIENITAFEDNIYGINHATISSAVCQEWGVPEEISTSISLHHEPASYINENSEPSDKVAKLLAILMIAGMAENQLSTGGASQEWERYGSLVMGFLKLNEVDVSKLLEEMKTTINNEI